jgi:hypothetical protein
MSNLITVKMLYLLIGLMIDEGFIHKYAINMIRNISLLSDIIIITWLFAYGIYLCGNKRIIHHYCIIFMPLYIVCVAPQLALLCGYEIKSLISRL